MGRKRIKEKMGEITRLVTTIIAIVFSIFSFGAVENWSIITLILIISMGGIFSAIFKGNSNHLYPKTPLFWSISLLLFISILSIIPIPSLFIPKRNKMLTNSKRVESLLKSDDFSTNKIVTDLPKETIVESGADIISPEDRQSCLSVAPDLTILSFGPLLSCLIFIWLIEGIGKRGINIVRIFLAITGILFAGIGIIQHIVKPDSLLWLRHSRYTNLAFGPWVNANHASALLNLLIPIAYAIILKMVVKSKNLSNRIGLWFIFCQIVALHLLALYLAGSVGGFIGLLAIPFALLSYVAFGYHISMARSILGILLFVFIISIFIIGMHLPMSIYGKTEIWKETILSNNFPWLTGFGLNTFSFIHPAFISNRAGLPTRFYTHMENEAIQLIFETGIIGIILLIIWALIILRLFIRVIKYQRESSVWMIGGIMAGIIQSMIDFPFHSLGFTLPFITILLILFYDSNTVKIKKSHRSENKEEVIILKPSDA